MKNDLWKVVWTETISAMKGPESESQLPGLITWIGHYVDPGRTVINGIKRFRAEMIRVEDEGFMMFWHASIVGWIACWKQGVEEAMEIPVAYETDIANLHRPIRVPQGMSVRMIKCKLFAEDVEVGHRAFHWEQESRGGKASKDGVL